MSQPYPVKCRKCRTLLMDSTDQIEPHQSQHSLPQSFVYSDQRSGVRSVCLLFPWLIFKHTWFNCQVMRCTHLFVCELPWMDPIVRGVMEGVVCIQKVVISNQLQIPCPKCEAKLGTFSWHGMQCSCGSWVTPAFALHKCKIDLPLSSPSNWSISITWRSVIDRISITLQGFAWIPGS